MPDAFDRAVHRLARNMAITQVSLSTKPPAALFALNIPALESALEDVKALIDSVPSDRIVEVPQVLIGPATADVLADAITPTTPDTIPEDWSSP